MEHSWPPPPAPSWTYISSKQKKPHLVKTSLPWAGGAACTPTMHFSSSLTTAHAARKQLPPPYGCVLPVSRAGSLLCLRPLAALAVWKRRSPPRERGGADQPPSSRASKITSLEKQLLIYSASMRRLFLFVNKCGKIKMEMCEHNSTTTKHESFTDTRLVSVPISVCFCRGADPSPQPIYTESTLNVKPQTSAKHMAHTPHLLEAFWRPDLGS